MIQLSVMPRWSEFVTSQWFELTVLTSLPICRVISVKIISVLINEFRCYEAKIEESEKAGSRRESNPGHLLLDLPVLCHWATTAGQPPTLTILYMHCTGGTECLSHTPASHSVCAVRTPLGVDRKILSVRKEPMLSGFSHSKCHNPLYAVQYI